MKGPFRNKQGSSLLEIVVAIAVLGLMVAPVCTSLVLSHRLNADSERILQARLLVESTVEQLMAEGIRYEKDETGEYERYVPVVDELPDGVTVLPVEIIGADKINKPWYKITVQADDVTVQTIVKAAPAPVEVLEEAEAPAIESEGEE